MNKIELLAIIILVWSVGAAEGEQVVGSGK